MVQEDILKMLRVKPFVPFRIEMTTGETYDIRHPELAMPTPTTIFIGIPVPNSPLLATSDYVIVSLFHVVKLEPLSPVTPSNN